VRFLFKPAWMLFIIGVVAFAVCCYTLLAPWQFRRNAEQQALNEAVTASYTHEPQPLAALVTPGQAPSLAIEWRQVTVRGEYLPGSEALVRLRTIDGDPAFEVLTALRTETGRIVAVDRGFIRPLPGNAAPPFAAAPPGPVVLTGRIRRDEIDDNHRAPIVVAGRTQVYAADSRQLGQVSGLSVDPGYLLLDAGQAGGLGVVPLPPTSDGPFLSYAWQWLTFGAMALFGLGYFVRLEILQRRDAHDDDHRVEAEESEPVDPLVQRYGKARF
jgi:cytochrome oxidase assembly protein ShyY1